MITRDSIKRAVEILVREARPEKIILFGSCARNEEKESSDVDFFVIEKKVADKRREMVRLRKALRPLRIPVDLMVSDESTVKAWGSLPGTAMYWALKEGTVLYESA
jgi:predicted nucleotidyltransferase